MRFLVAYDNTDGARAALAAVAPIARAARADVVVLHVLNPLVDAAGVFAATTREAMTKLTDDARERIQEQALQLGLTVEARVEPLSRDEDDWEHIVHSAEDVGADLIAIGSRRAGGLTGKLLGSVASSVVQHSHCPVLVVRPEHHP